MKWYEEFFNFLSAKWQKPTAYGWFHLMWWAIMIATCILIYIFRRKISKKSVNNILLVTSIVLIVFEIYKQLIYSFNYNGGGGKSYWDYLWYSFPFQFCSTPMYLMLLTGILRKGKVYDSTLCYLATYALFAGLIVMIYPGDVFSYYIGISIHTMVWHTSMFIIGFLLLATRSININLKAVLKATIIFIIMLAIALVLNIIWHYAGTSETFNMFFISPYYPCTLVILNTIYANAPYIVFLMSYIVGFVLAATIINLFAILFAKLDDKISAKRSTVKVSQNNTSSNQDDGN